MRECFQQLAHDSDCRAVVLTGAGKMFSSGRHLNVISEFVFGVLFFVLYYVFVKKIMMDYYILLKSNNVQMVHDLTIEAKV